MKIKKKKKKKKIEDNGLKKLFWNWYKEKRRGRAKSSPTQRSFDGKVTIILSKAFVNKTNRFMIVEPKGNVYFH